MAGRGTDIILGGNPDFKARQSVYYLIKEFQDEKGYCIALFPNKAKAEVFNLQLPNEERLTQLLSNFEFQLNQTIF